MAALTLGPACTQATPGAAERAQPGPAPAPAAAGGAEAPPTVADPPPTPPAVGEGLALAYRFTAGDRWREAVDLELHSSRAGEAPDETPTMIQRRRELFEIVDAGPDGASVRVTLERVELEPRGGAAIDSDAEAPPPADAFALERLALVDVPMTYRLGGDGATLELVDEPGLRAAADGRWEALRAEAGLAAPTAEERARFRHSVADELTSSREWGIRPVLPRAPVAVGGAWTESVRTSTLFNAEVVWTIRHALEAADDGRVTITRDGEAAFNKSPTMARLLPRADAGLAGELVVDRESGALLRAETTVTALVEAAPQPDAGFPGGTLKMRRIVKRRRLDDAAE
ncbi:MAG: hypothetical protein R3A79_07695 [Nannocystaceae bacterium]